MTLREAGIGHWVFQTNLTMEFLEKHLEILWKLLWETVQQTLDLGMN